MSSKKKKTSKKKRPSQIWKDKDRFPVIFWVAGKLKRSLHAKAKAGKTSTAALFRAWGANGFPVKPAKVSKPKKKASKPKAAKNAKPNGKVETPAYAEGMAF